MARDTYFKIRSLFRLYELYNKNVAVQDPPWHGSHYSEHFTQNVAFVAVLVRFSLLNENIVRCKSCAKALSYIKFKPVKCDLQFYAVVRSSHTYLHSELDNGSWNTTGTIIIPRYTTIFAALCCPTECKVHGRYIQKSSPLAFWCAQMAHQTILHLRDKKSWLMVMNKFFTWSLLVRQLEALSKGECNVLGTVKFNNMAGRERQSLKDGTWKSKKCMKGCLESCKSDGKQWCQ